ncbi:MAG: hypothetical protein OEM41_00300 [Ignavibacteria bacterium]|nr:hypothetical protein [Ignavibacteria bacterium]
MNVGDIRSNSTPPPQTRHVPKSGVKPDAAHEHGKSSTVGRGADEANEVFSTDETKYFEGLFPDSIQEIRSYATYRKEGDTPPAVLGSLIDRKG